MAANLMTKKNVIHIILLILLSVATGVMVYLLKSNASLQLAMTESQTVAEEKIKTLEEQLAQLKKDQTAATGLEKSTPDSTENILKPDDEVLKDLPETPLTPPPSESSATTSKTEALSHGPLLTVNTPILDLGTISKKNGLAKATYELKNTGTLDLVISYAFTSCGCTVAPIKEDTTLKPGATYPMEVTYDPNFYGPDYELGVIEKTITLISNDSSKPFYKVKLKATVNP